MILPPSQLAAPHFVIGSEAAQPMRADSMWNEKYLRDKKGGFYRTYSDLTILSSWEERKITSSHFTSFDFMTLTKHNLGIYQHTWDFIHQT